MATDYRDPTPLWFGSAGDAYREGWERIFGNKKALTDCCQPAAPGTPLPAPLARLLIGKVNALRKQLRERANDA